MAKRRITSRPGLFGYIYHYDENGNYLGKSRPGLWGDRKIHYNENNKHISTSRPGFLAKEVHFDKENRRYISSYPFITGSVHYSNGRPIGTTKNGIPDTSYTDIETYGNVYPDDDDFTYTEEEYHYTGEEPEGNVNWHSVIMCTIIFTGIFCFAYFVLGSFPD